MTRHCENSSVIINDCTYSLVSSIADSVVVVVKDTLDTVQRNGRRSWWEMWCRDSHGSCAFNMSC